MIDSLLEYEESEAYRKKTASIAELESKLLETRHSPSCTGLDTVPDIARMIELDPVASMDKALANPLAMHAELLAYEWGTKQPEEAKRYLDSKKKSYRVEACLQAVSRARHDLQEQAGRTEASSEPARQEEETADTSSAPESFAQPVTPAKKSLPSNPANYNPENYEELEAMRKDLIAKPEETMAKIGEEGSLALRQRAIDSIMDRLRLDSENWQEASSQLENAIEQLRVIPDSPPYGLEIGPKGADGTQVAKWLDQQSLALRRAWAPGIVDRWVQVDPQAAMAWADALPENASRNQTVQTGIIIWTHRDPSAAIAYVDAMPAGELREVAISNAAASWKCVDPAAAKKWAEALPDSPGKQRALERLKR